MHIDLTLATVVYLIAVIIFIAAAVIPTRHTQLVAAGLAVFALAHIIR